ncbi:cytochrome P450 7A1 [Callorhinchus milii]|uniref:Cytochrome P450 family 7 subfamily A member 1 n=1 Tax=Callorhinchus milii TaxID=7868 RepID=A0A4W3JX79_CALMI|nr:cytochrome P450 7A1 [Callorhinchus milii]|eukprot:gi/632958194/ref/XP_007894899.1/ PREDICTED: cholesterol 7-alpha-monooxygenase [Callorhinchus milii]
MAGLSIWIVSVLVGMFLGWFLLLGNRRRWEAEPPLETGWIPYIGCAFEFVSNPFKFMQARQNKYGEIFTCKIAGKFITFITDPFSYTSVIRHGKSLDFQKVALTISKNVFGHVDFTKYDIGNDEIHNIFNRTLQGLSLGSLTSSMMENLQFVMSQGKSSSDSSSWTIENLYEFSCKIMFEAGHLTLFGKNDKAMKGGDVEKIKQQHDAIQFALEEFKAFDTVFPALVAGIPMGFFKTAKKARKALEGRLLNKTLREQDCKSALIKERMELFDSSSSLDEHNKAKTHVIMLWASQANTLPASFWSIYYLMRNPEALNAVKNEVENILKVTNQKPGDINSPIIFTREQLDSMTNMGSLINEVLRLSSASMMIRVATEDLLLTLDSGRKVAIRKGDQIALYPQLLHLDPEIYEDPHEFKYNRFLDENGKDKTTFYKNGRKLKYYLMPFGSGTSICPGRHFAINEIKQFLSLMLCYYDMELLDFTALSPTLNNTRAGLGILQPSNDVLFHYRLKQQPAKQS